MKHIYKDNDAARKGLEAWAKRLRLQDWQIMVTIERARDMPLEGKSGCVKWFVQDKSAHIMLLDPLDYVPNPYEEQDHEETLVHELLHLHFQHFENTEPGTLADTMLEQTINILSALLVEQHRNYWSAIQDVDV